jgi:lysophospholipase L1-like esterase
MEPVLMTQPLSSSRNALRSDWADLGNQDVFNAIIREVGRQEDVLVIDLVTDLREEIADWNAPMHLFWDGMHVTDEGSRVVGKEIARALRPTAQRIARESRTR